MDAERSERKPAGAGLTVSVRKIRVINADKPQMKTFSFDEIWTYLRARRGKNRQSAWIWMAAVEEWDSSRRADFKVGYRDMETFLRLLHRLPKAAAVQERPLRDLQPPAVGSARGGEGERGEPKQNKGLRSKFRVKLNRLVRRTRGYGERLYTLAGPLAIAPLGDGLYQR